MSDADYSREKCISVGGLQYILTPWIWISMLLARSLQTPCFPILSFLLSQKPTRVTDESATLIDNIFCNKCVEIRDLWQGFVIRILVITFLCTILITPMLYHWLTTCLKNVCILLQIWNVFSYSMIEKDWNSVLHSHATQNVYAAFYAEFSEVYNIFCSC